MESPFSLTNRTIAVIGAGSGIGEAVAVACGAQGARVVCLDIKAELAEATAERLRASGREAMSAACDITASSQVDHALAEAKKWHGHLDGVVCTPGVNVRKPIATYTDEDFDRVMGVNVKGTFHVLRAAGRLLRPQGWGSVVLFSSIRSQVVEPGQSVYAATKAAIVQLARAGAAEYAAYGVRVNAVAPGVVETPLTAPIKANAAWYGAYAAKNPMQRWATADEMAWPTVFLLSEASSYITGSCLVVDGGWLAVDGRFEPPGMQGL